MFWAFQTQNPCFEIMVEVLYVAEHIPRLRGQEIRGEAWDATSSFEDRLR